jgi:hypothetical protein
VVVVSLSPFTMAAIAEAGLPVKSGAGQDRAGLSRTGLAGNDALEHHDPPGVQLASQVGAEPPHPHTPSDLRERQKCAGFSRRESEPLEKPAQIACGTVHLYRLEDGRLLARRVDCRTKACAKCGRRLRGEYAAGYAAVLAGEALYRVVVAARDWRKLQVKLNRAGAKFLRIPASDDRLVVYTTADLGERVRDIASTLAGDFAAMPSDRRNVSASTSWRKAFHAWREDQRPTSKAPAEHLGQLRRTLEQVALIAAELDLLVDQHQDALLLRDPPDQQTWQRFCARAGLYRRRREEVAA